MINEIYQMHVVMQKSNVELSILILLKLSINFKLKGIFVSFFNKQQQQHKKNTTFMLLAWNML